MKKILWLAAILSILSPQVFAEGNNYGSSSYFSRGVGGRAEGMGGAFVALADDATAGYWNPAGYGQMDLYLCYVGLQYALIAPDVNSYYASYAIQVPEKGTFALSWINYGTYNIEGRDDVGELTQPFSSMENMIILSYGTKAFNWLRGLTVGANLKILHQLISDSQATGFGFDVGAIWQPVLYWDHTLGINIQNIAQQLYWQTDSHLVDRAQVNAKIGTALRFFPSEDALYFHHLVATLDFDVSENYRLDYHSGVEYWYVESLGVRGGFDGREISIGASYRPNYYEIDYAFIYDLSELGFQQHRISVMMRFK